MQVRLASLESNKLLPYTKGCPDRWLRHAPPKLKSKSNQSELNFLNGYVCVPFSCFWRGFYRTYGAIIIVLIVHSCLSCVDDRRRDRYYALIR